MKKLLTCLSLFVMLFAFASMASAASLFTEDFANKGGKSLNWTVEPASGIDFISRASVSGTNYLEFVLGLHTVKNEFKSVQSFDFVAGDTYTMTVNAFHTLTEVIGANTKPITIAFMVGDAIIASITEEVRFNDMQAGKNNNTEVILDFVADQNYSGVKMAIFLGQKNMTFGFANIQLDGKPAATPIPAAAILLAPGLVGIAALRKRMS